MENETVDNTEIVEEEVLEEEVSEAPEEEEVDETEEVDDRDSKIEELEKQVKTLKIQKGKAKEKATATPAPANGDLSQTDLYALIKGDVAESDIQEVTDYAKLKGITVSEALNTPVMKTILEDNAETRTVANASNTGSTKRSQKQASEEALLKNARDGKMPTSDAEMERLIDAKLEDRRN